MGRYNSNRLEVMARREYGRYLRDAVKRRRIFTLMIEDLMALITKPCYYCSSPPARTTSNARKFDVCINGLDRLDNDVGYIKGNCVPCCQACNYMKGKLSYQEFIERVYLISRNFYASS